VGNYRNNHISGLGGNDALCGEKGRDIVDGGTGNDITYGGVGRDVHIGGVGRDVFVVDLDAKSVDLFKDFQTNRDRIGLPFALHSNMIDVVNHRLGTALKLGTDTLAILQGTNPNQIEANDFVQVDFAAVRGVAVPYVTA
jgi:Ca2+-binding RTX toxin-like protein